MSEATCLRLDGEMTIHRAAELKPVLLDGLRSASAALELDLSDVSEIDSSGVQLLLMLQETARAERREVRLGAISEPVQHVLRLLGLDALIAPTTTG